MQLTPEHVFDFANKFSDRVHKIDELSTLNESIKRFGIVCGSCKLWMKRNCPREKHNNQTGRSSGPSSEDRTCDKFDMNQRDMIFMQEAKEKIERIKRELSCN